jgi:hypothetical protein
MVAFIARSMQKLRRREEKKNKESKALDQTSVCNTHHT